MLDGDLTSLVTSLQISGFTIYFVNTSLEEDGLYVTKEFHRHTISESLAKLESYMNSALNLLCFRDDCIGKSNLCNERLIALRLEKQNKKRPAEQIQSSELTEKQELIRGTWNPSRGYQKTFGERHKYIHVYFFYQINTFNFNKKNENSLI